jgi:hypothetical protein
MSKPRAAEAASARTGVLNRIVAHAIKLRLSPFEDVALVAAFLPLLCRVNR